MMKYLRTVIIPFIVIYVEMRVASRDTAALLFYTFIKAIIYTQICIAAKSYYAVRLHVMHMYAPDCSH